jgi:hypothetical protein
MDVRKLSGKLSAVLVKQAKPKDKTYKLSDGKGLNLEVRPNNSKYWRQSYRYHDKQKTLALGVFPEVTLAIAWSKSLEAKQLLDQGIDPAIQRKQQKSGAVHNIFSAIAKEWHEKEAGRNNHLKDDYLSIW